jgi:hypothetical protein
MCDRFRERHPISLETRRKYKYVGCQKQFIDACRRHGAKHGNPVAETAGLYVGVKLRGGGWVASAVAGNRKPPRLVGEGGDRSDQ